MTIVQFRDLPSLRGKFKDKKIVFCSGCFDLLHAGHIVLFEKCKKKGDILVVSLGGDKLLKRYKGDKRPIITEDLRLLSVDALRAVDYCFIEPDFPSENTQIGLDKTFELLRPDIYALSNLAVNSEYRKELCKKYNISLEVVDEFPGISTTAIVEKIRSL